MSDNRMLARWAMVLAGAIALAGCGPSRKVVRDKGDQPQDLSGNWNDTDADQVAKTMIGECLGGGWLNKFKEKEGRDPVIKLYPIRNKTSEHINDKYFTKQVESALLNSGRVEVVASKEEVADITEEQDFQAKNASDETAKSAGNQTGTDYILNGWVVSQNDAVEGQAIRAYVTTMELIHAETGKKAWIKDHKIRKYVEQAGAQF